MPPDITFTRALASALPPMPADKSALGFMPVSAFQYCEAMRTAAGLGWYLFPPLGFSLMFDGRETFIADAGQWRAFVNEPLDPAFHDTWDRLAPPALRGHAPGYLRHLSNPGVVQIWTGYFVETAPGLALQIRPIVNAMHVSAYSCYEGIVETDTFRPMPLFINLQLHRTDSEIVFDRAMPLFQVAAVDRAGLRRQTAQVVGLEEAGLDWDGAGRTLRVPGSKDNSRPVGAYGAAIRRRDRPGPPDGAA
jgi:hypothetical protein